MFGKAFLLFAATCAFAAASDVPFEHYPVEGEDFYDVYSPEEIQEYYRIRRSLQPGAPNVPTPNQQNGGWAVSPNVAKDQSGNTRADIEVQHKGKDHDFNAGWGKVVRGPNRAKPTFHVGGTFRW